MLRCIAKNAKGYLIWVQLSPLTFGRYIQQKGMNRFRCSCHVLPVGVILGLVLILMVGSTLPIQAQITSVPDSSQAAAKFGNLAGSLQVFAGVLLLIGCVFAGIMFMTGKSQMAIMVFLGAAVVFGGAYVVGLIMGALK